MPVGALVAAFRLLLDTCRLLPEYAMVVKADHAARIAGKARKN